MIAEMKLPTPPPTTLWVRRAQGEEALAYFPSFFFSKRREWMKGTGG